MSPKNVPVPSQDRATIDFHYIKSPQYRTVHVDGVWGGVTPRGWISMSFYSERNPVPRQLKFKLVDQQLGDEVRDERVSREGVIREVEVAIMADPSFAKSLIEWLQEKLDQLERAKSEAGLPPTIRGET